ncbi:MAG TPA: acyltransferase [Bacteroidia bacterium]|jgi:peptidoglycan/LPS O-acetylase OafA/YrhL|nr:acyltransferase [Bacteroidia bacterium]
MKEETGNLFFINEKENNYLKVLDGLRGLAILLVLLTHSGNWDIVFCKYINLKLAGREIICLFFILSAYLVSRQFARALINNRFNFSFCKKYLGRRLLRIYPLFIICLLVFGTITHYFGKMGMYGYPFSNVLSHLFFLKGEGMFWAVAVEFKYYFALPLLLIVCYKAVKLKVIPFLMILLVLNALAGLSLNIFHLPSFPFVESFPVFSMGCFIAVLEANGKLQELSQSRIKFMECAGWLSVIVLFILIPANFNYIFGHEHSPKDREDYFIMALLWSSVLLAAIAGQGLFKRIFELKIFRFLGNISYSLYLFHLPVLFFVNLYVASSLKIYVFVVASLIIASVIYLLIERPMAILKLKYFSDR